MTYTIEVPEPSTYAGRFERLFDWIDSGSIEFSDFLNLCFSGSVSARESRAVARSFGVSSEETFPLFWGVVLACYFDKPLVPACRLSDRYWSELLTDG